MRPEVQTSQLKAFMSCFFKYYLHHELFSVRWTSGWNQPTGSEVHPPTSTGWVISWVSRTCYLRWQERNQKKTTRIFPWSGSTATKTPSHPNISEVPSNSPSRPLLPHQHPPFKPHSITSAFTAASPSLQALQRLESGSASLKRISRKRDMRDDIKPQPNIRGGTWKRKATRIYSLCTKATLW